MSAAETAVSRDLSAASAGVGAIRLPDWTADGCSLEKVRNELRAFVRPHLCDTCECISGPRLYGSTEQLSSAVIENSD
jgi:hypothetical protein